MRKMPHSLIFALLAIIFIAVVFAGCLSFRNSLPGINGSDDEADLSQDDYPADLYGYGEGGTLFSGEDLESIRESLYNAEASAAANDPGVPATSPNGEPATASGATPGTAPDTTQAPATPGTTQGSASSTGVPAPTANNEYEILRSGTAYCKGTMTSEEGDTPMELAFTPNSTYALSNMGNVEIAILVSNGTTYLLYPPEKIYIKLSDTVLSIIGMDPDDLDASELSFKGMPSLSESTALGETELNGTRCLAYKFQNTGGSTVVYLNGDKLLGIRNFSPSGAEESATYFTAVSGSVPADKSAPPADYTSVNIIRFMSVLGNVME